MYIILYKAFALCCITMYYVLNLFYSILNDWQINSINMYLSPLTLTKLHKQGKNILKNEQVFLQISI